jgi:hypothetical protein
VFTSKGVYVCLSLAYVDNIVSVGEDVLVWVDFLCVYL